MLDIIVNVMEVIAYGVMVYVLIRNRKWLEHREQCEEVMIMSFDYSKLAGRIKEKFGTQSKFALAMGLSERSLSLKINNGVSWKQTEILKASELLEIKKEQVYVYFFIEKVQNYEPKEKSQ